MLFTYLQEGFSALHASAVSGYVEVVKYLCELGKSKLVGLKNNSQMSALSCAEQSGNLAVVQCLRDATCLQKATWD